MGKRKKQEKHPYSESAIVEFWLGNQKHVGKVLNHLPDDGAGSAYYIACYYVVAEEDVYLYTN